MQNARCFLMSGDEYCSMHILRHVMRALAHTSRIELQSASFTACVQNSVNPNIFSTFNFIRKVIGMSTWSWCTIWGSRYRLRRADAKCRRVGYHSRLGTPL